MFGGTGGDGRVACPLVATSDGMAKTSLTVLRGAAACAKAGSGERRPGRDIDRDVLQVHRERLVGQVELRCPRGGGVTE